MQTTIFRPIRIFSNKLEVINLLFPFVFVMVSLGEIFFVVGNLTPREMAFWRGMAATLFLNTTHVGLSYTAWFSFPEVKNWLKRQYNLTMWKSLAIVVAITGSLFFLVAYASPVPWLPTPLLNLGIVFVSYDILLIWHGLGQSKGLSLLYNRKILRDGNLLKSDLNRFRSIESIERRGITWLIVSYSLMQLVPFLLPNTFEPLAFKLFFVGINISLVLMIVVSALMLPGSQHSNKLIHCGRYLLWILTPGSFFASIGLLAVHGVEYTIVNCEMSKKSDLNKKQLNVWVMLSIGVGLLYFVLGGIMPNGFGGIIARDNSWLAGISNTAVAFVMATTVIHCIFDRHFYSMSGSDFNRKDREKLLL